MDRLDINCPNVDAFQKNLTQGFEARKYIPNLKLSSKNRGFWILKSAIKPDIQGKFIDRNTILYEPRGYIRKAIRSQS